MMPGGHCPPCRLPRSYNGKFHHTLAEMRRQVLLDYANVCRALGSVPKGNAQLQREARNLYKPFPGSIARLGSPGTVLPFSLRSLTGPRRTSFSTGEVIAGTSDGIRRLRDISMKDSWLRGTLATQSMRPAMAPNGSRTGLVLINQIPARDVTLEVTTCPLGSYL